MNNYPPTTIIGTGGLAMEIYGMLTDMGVFITGFICEPGLTIDSYMDLPVLGDDRILADEKYMPVVIANGQPSVRRKIAEKLEGYLLRYPCFIHPNTTVFKHGLKFKNGLTVMPGGVIQPNVEIGKFVHINMGVTIGHDTVIGDYCVINHNAGISGRVKIGNGVLVGAGAVIKENLTIGEGATIGMGAIVTKDVPPHQVWVSTAASELKRRTY